MGTSVELRIMPNGEDSGWYGKSSKTGARLLRGVADTEPAACQRAHEAAQKAELVA
jgi:hypothetical protein